MYDMNQFKLKLNQKIIHGVPNTCYTWNGQMKEVEWLQEYTGLEEKGKEVSYPNPRQDRYHCLAFALTEMIIHA